MTARVRAASDCADDRVEGAFARRIEVRIVARAQIDRITPASHAAALARIGPAAEIVRRASAGGALAGQSLEFVGSVVEGLAGTTMDYMIRDPARADAYCDAGFEAAWRALA